MARTSPLASRAAGGNRYWRGEGASARAWLLAGVVGRAHGLDGSFYVGRPKPQLLVTGMIVALAAEQRRVIKRAGTEQRPIIQLEGCADRAAAESLRGQEILVARARAPALEAEEWWAEDLEGCTVRQGDQIVGVVRRLLAWPSCEVLEVAREGQEELLVPLVRAAVPEVNLDHREIEVDLGFLGTS